MKQTVLILLLAASAAGLSAQAPAKPAAPAAKPAVTAAKPVVSAAHTAAPAAAGVVQDPPGIPVVKGLVKSAFTLRYKEIKVGTGALAEPYKMYKVNYTGWLAADGHKFDSNLDHPVPVMDKDGKPVMGEDGKPKMGDPQPFSFPEGFGRVIPGWDQGFEGMKIGGKRRLYIPYQLAYGYRGHPTGDPKNPGIPPKAALIFDVELLDITDLQMPANHPGGAGMPGMGAARPAAAPPAGAAAAPAKPAEPAAPAPAPQPK